MSRFSPRYVLLRTLWVALIAMSFLGMIALSLGSFVERQWLQEAQTKLNED